VRSAADDGIYRSASHLSRNPTRRRLLGDHDIEQSVAFHVTLDLHDSALPRCPPPPKLVHIITSSNQGVSDPQTGPEQSAGTETGVARALYQRLNCRAAQSAALRRNVRHGE